MLRSLGIDGFRSNSFARARSFFETLKLWHERDRQRRLLASLDGRFLRDIGISSGDAAYEANKPFWRA